MRLFVGGTRSGKSALAQQWAERHASGSNACLLYVATCRVEDGEMAARVAAHRAQRGPAWAVLEEAIDPLRALNHLLATPHTIRAVVLDCVSLWLANLMADGHGAPEIAKRVANLASGMQACGLPCALVSAEVGMGLVPENPVGRQFRDVLGEANQILARMCDTVIFATCGLPLTIKGQA